MKVILKKKTFLKFLFIFASSPIFIATSCNVRTTREIKNSTMDPKVWESQDWKTLESMIQTKFKDAVIRQMFTNNIYWNTNSANSRNQRSLSEIAKAKTAKEISRIFLEQKGGVGNYATDTLANVFRYIRSNKLIPIKYKLLLNQINTVYNRTINIYPTKIFPKLINGDKYMHIEFRADLITPMKRRFVRKFLDLKFDFPIFDRKYSQVNLRKFYKITEFSNPNALAKQIKTADQMYNIWISTVTNDIGIRSKGNGIIDETSVSELLGTTQLLNLNSGFYPLNAAKRDLYKPSYTGRIDHSNAPETYTFANWHPLPQLDSDSGKYVLRRNDTNREFVTLNKNDKVSKLEQTITTHFFTNSQMPLFKALFGPQGNWKIKVEAQTWAGNAASNYTIGDWVENIGHRGNFAFYIINKNDPTQSYYYLRTAGMARVQEEIGEVE